jgi:hypothetical protein
MHLPRIFTAQLMKLPNRLMWPPRSLIIAGALMGAAFIAALTVPAAPTDAAINAIGPAAEEAPATPATAVIFVVDSTNTLWGFDTDARIVATVPVSASVGRLNGALTFAMGRVYAVIDRAPDTGGGNWVVAFNGKTLKQNFLHRGAFTLTLDPDAPAGSPLVVPGEMDSLTYDEAAQRFFVATTRAGVLMFDRVGMYVPRLPESMLAVSSIALDRAHKLLWAATDHRAIMKFAEDANAPVAELPRTGSLYRGSSGPRAVAYCTGGGGYSADVLIVAFGSAVAGSRSGHGAAQAFDTDGKPVGKRLAGKIIAPHAISCSTQRQIYIAADNGLLEFTPQGQQVRPRGDFAKLTAPVLGVLAVN